MTVPVLWVWSAAAVVAGSYFVHGAVRFVRSREGSPEADAAVLVTQVAATASLSVAGLASLVAGLAALL